MMAGAFAASAAQKKTDLWIAVGFVAFILILERSLALFHARRFVREFIPEDGTAHMAVAATAR